MVCTFLFWIMRPHRYGFLYAFAFLLGASFNIFRTTAAMTVLIMAATFIVGLEQFSRTLRETTRAGGRFHAFMVGLAPFWEVGAAGLLSNTFVRLVFWRMQSPDASIWNSHAWCYPRAPLVGAAIAVGLLAAGRLTGGWKVWRALACAGCFLAGLALYLYLPLAASTNPPMNWGYTATKTGFMHFVRGGSYESFTPSSFFTHEFAFSLWRVAQSLVQQYAMPVVLFGLASLPVLIIGWKKMKSAGRRVMVVLWLGLLVMGFEFAFNVCRMPASYLEEMLNCCSTPAHLFAAMLIGISLALFLSVVVALKPAKAPVLWSCVVLLSLPLIPLTRNWRDCNLHSNDFAYLFGHHIFEPGGGYTPMEKKSVLFGGTDDARFVSTYMIFCESQVATQYRFQDKQFDRSDVYILAQNALADNTYMSYIRDQYDFSRPTNTGLFQRLLGRDYSYPQMPIYLPGQQDSSKVFQQYVEDVRAGRIFTGRDINISKGLIADRGVSGVMCINGILARWIFDRNKDMHSFYVEESYVIPWMYPYLRPSGIILKLEKQPLPSPEENPVLWQAILTHDQAYWDKLTAELLARADFHRNEAARQCFSKLRVAIARVYAFRELNVEAENVLQQALQLWPQSPDASFQLAALYLGQHRYREARYVMETYLKLDPTNQQARDLLETIHIAERDDIRRQIIEGQTRIRNGSSNIDLELELAAIYQRQGMDTEFEGLVQSLISGTNLPPQACSTLATLSRGSGQENLHMAVLQYWLRNDENDFTVWVELAFAVLAQNRQKEALGAFKHAIELGGSNALLSFRFDPRLEPLRNSPEFQSLIVPQ